jgi:ribosomal protein L7/L12
MSTEQDILTLRSRVHELEERLKFVYQHLQIEYVQDQQAANANVVALIKAGNKIEAIKVYREIYNVGLAEAKRAVDGMEEKLLSGNVNS